MKFKVIDGGYQKGIWMHDRDAHTQEEIDALNEAFRLLGQDDPRFLKLIWDIKVDSFSPDVRIVK